ncbi:MAG: lipid A deacylase LpxR family protein [Betaproteobacteria bacterium]
MFQRTVMLLVGMLLLSAAGEAAAQFVSLTADNDYFARADRHYTGGLQLGLLLEAPAIPAGLRATAPLSWSADPQLVLAFGQRIYVPNEIDVDPPSPKDRPYAGWTYLLADLRTKNGPVIDHVIAGIGMVGPGSGARQVQTATHRLFGSRPADGWSSQLRNEVGVMAGFERTWPGVLRANAGSNSIDIAVRAGATVGNVFTYAATSVIARFGSHLPDDLPATQLSLLPSRDGFHGATGRGWYAWLGAEARAVAWNVFLDGNMFRDSASVERRPLGYDLQTGFAYVWPTARVGFALIVRGREFSGQEGPDRYGQLTLSMGY